MTEPLTTRDREVLDFEATPWRQGGGKESAIRDQLKMTWIEYYLHLSRVIDKEAALQHAPTLVARLRRLRDTQIRRKYVRGG